MCFLLRLLAHVFWPDLARPPPEIVCALVLFAFPRMSPRLVDRSLQAGSHQKCKRPKGVDAPSGHCVFRSKKPRQGFVA